MRTRGPQLWELLPEVALVAGLTFFLIDETDAATSAFKSGRAIGLMALVSVLWVAARLGAARFVHIPGARMAIFALAAAAVLAVVVVPAYDDETVVEALGDSPAVELASPQPTRLRLGAFQGIDHRAKGTVAVYRRDDGRFVIGLEDFDIQPGPDYDVYVVPGADQRDTDDGLRVDDLRGNRGTQFYAVPEQADLEDGPWTVLVWCQTFSVPVANATPV